LLEQLWQSLDGCQGSRALGFLIAVLKFFASHQAIGASKCFLEALKFLNSLPLLTSKTSEPPLLHLHDVLWQNPPERRSVAEASDKGRESDIQSRKRCFVVSSDLITQKFLPLGAFRQGQATAIKRYSSGQKAEPVTTPSMKSVVCYCSVNLFAI
jgi:hypothetical protein